MGKGDQKKTTVKCNYSISTSREEEKFTFFEVY